MQECIQRPFEAKSPEAQGRLVQLLQTIMVRAAKSQLRSLPPLSRTVSTCDDFPDSVWLAEVPLHTANPLKGHLHRSSLFFCRNLIGAPKTCCIQITQAPVFCLNSGSDIGGRALQLLIYL